MSLEVNVRAAIGMLVPRSVTLKIPPPLPVELFPLTLLRVSVMRPAFAMPPPLAALLPMTSLSVNLAVPNTPPNAAFRMPPPRPVLLMPLLLQPLLLLAAMASLPVMGLWINVYSTVLSWTGALNMPPPRPVNSQLMMLAATAWLPVTGLSVRNRWPALAMPPPTLAVLPVTVHLFRIVVPWLAIPPPLLLGRFAKL
jgi:hypothetical protein